MAYYSPNYLEGYTGEYQDPCYYTTYDVVPYQFSQSYSSFDPYESQTIEYNHSTSNNSFEIINSSYGFSDPKLTEYNNFCDSDNYANNSEMNYSVYSFSEPTVITYDPAPYQTQHFISYKTVTFNELNNVVYDPTHYDGSYDEYDPTPYDGGFDQTVTYGKPLPPSDQICYPRSNPNSTGLSLDGFSYNSIPSPYGDHDSGSDSLAKPLEGSKVDDSGTIMDLTKPNDFNEEEQSSGELESAVGEQYDTGNRAEIEGFNNGHDYPWLYYDYGYGNGRNEGWYDKYYDCDKQIVAQTQHGYGSDGVNYCESILGYWPCLAKKNKKKNELVQENGDTRTGSDSHLPKETDLWKTTVEYIFGS